MSRVFLVTTRDPSALRQERTRAPRPKADMLTGSSHADDIRLDGRNQLAAIPNDLAMGKQFGVDLRHSARRSIPATVIFTFGGSEE